MADTEILALHSLSDEQNLTALLSLLFEPSPPLHSLLVPSVLLRLVAAEAPPTSYNHLIDICAQVAEGWTLPQKGEFLSGHPMIGEVQGLSKLSGKEQGGAVVTPKVVLDRLAHLNALYCKIYPGLRYITFVNGRPRTAIIPELEGILHLPVSPNPLPDDFPTTQPGLHSTEVEHLIKSPDSAEWRTECERGLADVWLIGRARLQGLGLE
ncbi:hypothetical protein P7C73_g2933, partial [Tremellales sp. Uapishka_1]